MKDNKLRQNVNAQILNSPKHHIILEAGTGVGKTLMALHKMAQLFAPHSKILIVIPRLVLIDNWRAEFRKWHYDYMLPKVTFVTYISFPKMAGTWSIVCYDEAHHLSSRCREALSAFHIDYGLYLSATLKKDIFDFLKSTYGSQNIEHIVVSTQRAIKEEILPDPQILLVPLELDIKNQDITYVKKKPHKGEKPLIIPYEQKWKYRSYKGALSYRCSQRQYYNELSGLIEWYKGKSTNPIMRNMWLHKCGERLHWLSMIKLPFTLRILHMIHSRFIVFCNTIVESSALKIPAVNSQIGLHNLQRFNAGEIHSLAAVNMLNEGMNLSNCKVGIFNAINASETYRIQKTGRILRHASPVLIIPYYQNTREEEIVRKWIQDYNPQLIIHASLEQLNHYKL